MASRLLRWFTPRRRVLLLAVLIVAALATPQVWAWSKLRAARAALARHHPEEARAAIRSCQRVWGDRVSVRMLSCRAAWQADDLEAAVRELREAQRLEGKATDETAFEWALVQAAGGNVGEVEQYLQQRAEQSPDAAPLVWEALAVGYLRIYRTLDAMACVNFWLERAPNNIRALDLRGQIYIAGKGVVRGAEDYRRVLELDPTRNATRRRLIDALLSLGGFQEAMSHLERIAPEYPDDPSIPARLARCYMMDRRGDDARRLLDAALAKHPDDALCLRTLGQLEIVSGRPAEAEVSLRRAVARTPDDYQAQQLLFQALLQQGKSDEAKAQLAVAEAVRDRAARISDLTSRKLAEFPLDPALHYEMGKLMIETGRADVGERWLLTALALDTDHQPAHAALAAHYESRGDRAKADFHRAKATSEPK